MEKVKLPKWDGAPLLPSAFQLGEYVHLSVGEKSVKYANDNVLKNGKVIKILFSPGKVCYDLEFTVSIDNENDKRYTTRIHNVDSALCESVDPEINGIREDCLSAYTEASPFNHGGWHNATDLPTAKQGDGSYASVDVLCDVDGKRKNFRVGWYDFEDKEWRFHDDDQSFLEEKHLRWAYIPI